MRTKENRSPKPVQSQVCPIQGQSSFCITIKSSTISPHKVWCIAHSWVQACPHWTKKPVWWPPGGFLQVWNESLNLLVSLLLSSNSKCHVNNIINILHHSPTFVIPVFNLRSGYKSSKKATNIGQQDWPTDDDPGLRHGYVYTCICYTNRQYCYKAGIFPTACILNGYLEVTITSNKETVSCWESLKG